MQSPAATILDVNPSRPGPGEYTHHPRGSRTSSGPITEATPGMWKLTALAIQLLYEGPTMSFEPNLSRQMSMYLYFSTQSPHLSTDSL